MLSLIRNTSRVELELVESLNVPPANLHRGLVAWQFNFQVNIMLCYFVSAITTGTSGVAKGGANAPPQNFGVPLLPKTPIHIRA